MSDALITVELENGPAEASALVRCESSQILQAHGFDRGFWVVLDEGRVEESVALLGHKRDKDLASGWKLKVLSAEPSCEDKTDDAECLARAGEWLYVLGSQFGSKDGPLQPKRAFVARFREQDVDGKVHKTSSPLEIARRPFVLHRAINDGLRDSGVTLIPMGPHSRDVYLAQTLRVGAKKDSPWAPLVRVEDWPINVEGLAFLEDGRAIVGLRYPLTDNGEPLLVELEGFDRLFEEDGLPPRVTQVWWLAGVGARDRSAGVRGLERIGDELHVLTGPIGTARKDSTITMDYPGSKSTLCGHWSVSLESMQSPGPIEPRRVRVFEDRQHVEGMALGDDGRWYYVSDYDESVMLHVTTVPRELQRR